jgi:DMSO/TMAO reductase YedYZ molybdopterin-dependent catalytic subunit
MQRTAAPRGAALAAAGAVVGIVTTLVALGVAQLVAAALSTPLGAPVDAVGELSIDHTPPAVKNFAIRTFGSNDKTVLVWGIRGVLIIFAVVIGIVAVRKLWYGMAGLAIFTAIGVYAALSQPTSKAADAVPTLIGAAVAAFALRSFAARAARAAPAGPATDAAATTWPSASGKPGAGTQPRAGSQPGTGSRPDAGPQPDASAEPASTSAGGGAPDPGASWLPPDYYVSERYQGARPPGASQPAASGRYAASARQAYAGEVAQDRRRFLVSGAVVAGASLLTYGAGTWLGERRDVSAAAQSLKLPAPAIAAPPLPPGANLRIPGLASFITPNSEFYRVDTAIVLPEILPANWTLRVHGMVRKELVLSFGDLIKRPLIEDYITLCCVSNPVGGPYIGNAKWLGASLRSLLQEAGIKAGASQLLATSSDGFTSGTPVQVAMDSGRDSMLAVAMNGAALPVEHGFPVRQVIPGLYGYVSACKWIVDIEVTTFESAQAYWVPRGWSPQAPIKTESRIDVPTGQHPVKAGTTVPIAGVAWAQHKGIEAVEVRISHGPWQPARLADVPDLDTWRQWVYDWNVTVPPGNYLIEARATDKTGYTQTALQEPPEPNGATGYPSVLVQVSS